MKNYIINWARKLRAIANNGLLYAETIYHKERYEAIMNISIEMFSNASISSEAEIKAIFSNEEGYSTPKIDVRAVVPFENKLLFVNENDDNLWCFPGGWLEIGETIRGTIEKEVLDEAGYKVKASKLLGIYDKDLHEDAPTSPYQVFTVYVLCEILKKETEDLKLETNAAAFFGENEIPIISKNRISIHQVQRMFEYIENGEIFPDFD